MGAEESRTCPRCSVQLSESNMTEHLKTCQRLYVNAKKSDGSELTIDYKSSSDTGMQHVVQGITSSMANKSLQYKQ